MGETPNARKRREAETRPWYPGEGAQTDDRYLARGQRKALPTAAGSYANMAKKPDSTNQAAEPSQASSPPSNAPMPGEARPKPGTPTPVNTVTSVATPPASVPPDSTVSAQKMLDVRTEPPQVPVTSDPKEVTPETGELSSIKVDATHDPAVDGRPSNRPVPGTMHIIPMRASPKEPSDQSDTEIVDSSPEPAQDEDQDDLSEMDWETLTDRHYQACAEVHQKTKELCRAQNKAMRLAKRMKTMQNAQGNAPSKLIPLLKTIWSCLTKWEP